MIAAPTDNTSRLAGTVGRVARMALRAVQTRAELLAVEWQEERLRLLDLLVAAMGLLLLGTMGVLLATVTIILLFPAAVRLYVTAAFAGLYVLAALGAWFGLKHALKRQPFIESVDQIKKDRVWLESLK